VLAIVAILFKIENLVLGAKLEFNGFAGFKLFVFSPDT